jgi:hypothetical protein
MTDPPRRSRDHALGDSARQATRDARLVSVLQDVVEHAGQTAYERGVLLRRP